jgi:hypothetical protein
MRSGRRPVPEGARTLPATQTTEASYSNANELTARDHAH